MFWGFCHVGSGAFWEGFSVNSAFMTLQHGVSSFQSCNFRNSFSGIIFKRMALSVSFLWDMLGTIYLYFGCFEFFHLLFHLLMESVLLVVFQKVIVGCWVVGVLLFTKLFLQVNLLAHFLQYLDGLGSERSLELFSFVGLSCESVIFVYYMITCA